MGKAARNKKLNRQQRLRRSDGRIVRVEVSLNADKKGDVFIADHLCELPPDTTKSDYLRAALLDKILAERKESDTDHEIASLRAEIADLKALIVDMFQDGFNVQMAQFAQVTVGGGQQPPPQSITLPELPPPPGEQQSSGLDMSRPRKRPKLKRGPVVEQEPAHDVAEEFDAIALGKLMSRSIKNAQPGRVTN